MKGNVIVGRVSDITRCKKRRAIILTILKKTDDEKQEHAFVYVPEELVDKCESELDVNDWCCIEGELLPTVLQTMYAHKVVPMSNHKEV